MRRVIFSLGILIGSHDPDAYIFVEEIGYFRR